MRRLTEGWLIGADARKEALRGRVVGVEEEDVARLGAASVFAGKKPGSLCDAERWFRVRWIGRRWTVAGEFTGEELSGEKRRWRRGFLALGEDGTEQRE